MEKIAWPDLAPTASSSSYHMSRRLRLLTQNRQRYREKSPGERCGCPRLLPRLTENLLVENRHGLIVNTEVFEANGMAERDAALVMLQQIPGT